MNKTMTANDIIWEKKDPIPYSTMICPKGCRCSSLMEQGRVLPTNKSQVRHFIKFHLKLGKLNYADVCNVETVFSHQKMKGIYKQLGQGWVALVNQSDFRFALLREYSML